MMSLKPFNLLVWMAAIGLILLQSCQPEDCDDPGNLVSLDKLAGDWIRVESNNPSSDHMKVKVVGNAGTVTDKAGSNFSVGDIKWRSIQPETHNTFAYEELGSDGNYYEASLTLVNDDELSLMVSFSGAGNSQKWVRDDGTISSGTPTELDCNYFAQDRTLTNTAASVDYVVPIGCVMDITTNLVIEPGVVIEFEENSGLGIYDQGTLKAIGTPTEPIIMRGKEQTKGYWRGIHLETNSINNRLEHVQITDAGSNYVYCCNEVAGFYLKDGKAVLQNTTIRNSGEYGLIIGPNAEIPEFESNTITENTSAPLRLSLSQAQHLDIASSFAGNDLDFIEVRNESISKATTIPRLSVPYLLDKSVIDIKEALTVEAGVEMIFQENGGLGVFDGGSLHLAGTAALEVRLRGKEASAGFWRGIHIETNSLNNKITYAHVSDAGGNYVYCCNQAATIFLKGNGKLQLQNSQLSQGASYGLYAGKTATLVEYGNNTITTHAKMPLYVAVERVGELDGQGSDYTGNQDDYIGIFNSQVLDAMTWPIANVPYLVDPTVIDITEPLTIDPGTEIVFQVNSGLGVYDNGSIQAIGTGEKQIIFRGQINVHGHWRGIHVETNSPDNEFKNVHLTNAGSTYVYCCNDAAGLYLKSGQMKVTSSLIDRNDGCGIFVKAGATLTESGNTFSDNSDGDICQ